MAPPAAELSPADLYPAVRQFFVDAGLARSLKAFDKDTAGEEATGAATQAAAAGLQLTAACQLWASAQPGASKDIELVMSNVYPAVRKFLDDAGLAKTAKSFNKETAEEAGAPGDVGTDLELTSACGLWLDTQAEAKAQRKAARKAAKKRELDAAAAAEEEEEAVEAPKKKKRKASEDVEATAPAPEAAPVAKAEKEKKVKKEKPAGVPFSRVDHEKWTAAINDDRLKDNTHEGKLKYGMGANGDSWGDKASADLLAVKGKGFRKEMQKKKRASWRGGGEIDQGCNSVFFPDSDDE